MSILTDNIQAMPILPNNIGRMLTAGVIDCTKKDLIYFDTADVQINAGSSADGVNYFITSGGDAFTVSGIDSLYVNAATGYILV